MDVNEIIVEPVLTEKTNSMKDGDTKKYTFKIHKDANKLMVKQAVKELFSVKPVKCNILNVKSKPRMSRTKSGFRYGKTTPWKKAIVTLSPGEKIDAFEGA